MLKEQNKMNKNIIAYNMIKDMILNNELKCGDIVSENSLAAKMNMSRTPVREAIQALYNEGYVEVHKGVGIFVKHVTLKEIYDINAVRVVLETFAVRNAVDDIQPNKLDDLINRWKLLKECLISGNNYDSNHLFELDEETHNLIIHHSGNDFLQQLIATLQSKIHRYQKTFTKIVNNDLVTIDQHVEILEAIKRKDVETACALLERHIYTPLRYMFENNKVDLY